MRSPGARQAAVWGTESALKYRRTLAVFLSVIPRTLKAQSSAAPSTLSSPSSSQQSGPSQLAENAATAIDCSCPLHEQHPKPDQAADSLLGGWLVALVAILLLIGMVPQPASVESVWATVIAALGAAITISLVNGQLLRSHEVSEPRWCSQLRLGATIMRLNFT
jgi:hypothetical protein